MTKVKAEKSSPCAESVEHLKRRCLGRTSSLRRCKRTQKTWFCEDHRAQPLLVWPPALVTFLAAVFGLCSSIFGSAPMPRLNIFDDKREIFSKLYFAGDPKESIPPLGGEIFYRHRITVANTGEREAKNIKVRLYSASDAHEVRVFPASIGHKVFGAVQEPSLRGPEGSQMASTASYRDLSIASLSASSNVRIELVQQIKDDTIPLIRKYEVVSDNATTIEVPEVDQQIVLILQKDLQKLLGGFKKPDSQKWDSSAVRGYAEFHPN